MKNLSRRVRHSRTEYTSVDRYDWDPYDIKSLSFILDEFKLALILINLVLTVLTIIFFDIKPRELPDPHSAVLLIQDVRAPRRCLVPDATQRVQSVCFNLCLPSGRGQHSDLSPAILPLRGESIENVCLRYPHDMVPVAPDNSDDWQRVRDRDL